MKIFQQQKPLPTPVSSRRIYLLIGLTLVSVTLVVARLFYWQIIMHQPLTARAEQQHIVRKTQEATRGKILAKNNEILATNTIAYQLSVIPKEIQDKKNFSLQIARYLDQDPVSIEQELEANPQYLILKQRLEKNAFKQLEQEKIEGLIATEIINRYYPEGEIAAHLLGFVNLENQGQYNMEEFFNGILSGQDGQQYLEVDPLQQPIPLGNREIIEPEEGAAIVTTIDLYLQEKLYSLLKENAEKFKASQGLIVVMEPYTGEIIAMVGYPSYDPNNYGKYFEERGAELFQNPCLEQFEPGSIFKVITLAAGLDSEVVNPTTTLYDSGKMQIKNHTIYNAGHAAYGTIDMADVLVWSSNIGAAYVAQQMGREVFDKYIRLFGFGKTTGIGLMGENPGIVYKPERWADLDLASIGFGQAIAVTPIQMITAMSAIANGGNLFKPMLIKKIIQNGQENEQMPRLMRRVIRENTAQNLTEMLVESVRRGYAKRAAIPGYTVAGKTGTAQVASPKGGYEENKVVGSLIGYAPAHHPRFVMLVSFHLNEKLDTPERWGEYTAGPVFAEAGKIILQHLGVPPG